MAQLQSKPLTKDELRAAVNAASRRKFGVPADRLPASTVAGTSEKSAAARRLAFAAHYAKK
jgi:hypothetical protein